MSRITKKNNKYEAAFGRDHVFGIFLQIFERTLASEDPVEDLNYLSEEELINEAGKYGFVVSKDDLRQL